MGKPGHEGAVLQIGVRCFASSPRCRAAVTRPRRLKQAVRRSSRNSEPTARQCTKPNSRACWACDEYRNAACSCVRVLLGGRSVRVAVRRPLLRARAAARAAAPLASSHRLPLAAARRTRRACAALPRNPRLPAHISVPLSPQTLSEAISDSRCCLCFDQVSTAPGGAAPRCAEPPRA